jgi:phage tail sheath protein FI
MPTYKTPGVYVEDIPALPPSVAEVETAIPAFVGYTEKAGKRNSNDLILKPIRISSMAEYEELFGDCAFDTIGLEIATSGNSFITTRLTPPKAKYILWYAVKMFFDNGGDKCYVVSVGLYQVVPVIDNKGDGSDNTANAFGLLDGINALKNKDEPTLLLVPEAVHLKAKKYQNLVQNMLLQCEELQDRFCIFDVYEGTIKLDRAQLSANRAYFGNKHLKYGAAYYPFLETGMSYKVKADKSNVVVKVDGEAETTLDTIQSSKSTAYKFVLLKLKEAYVTMPPSAAVAGIYAASDKTRGVWKAPANLSINNIKRPSISIDNRYQDTLNTDIASGKSINAIRNFRGKGTLVWGARTLAGNDNEWRYIPVRRFFITIEESLKQSTHWAVFEPNDANTWLKIRGIIEAYLYQKWRQGALAGRKSEEAFYVRCGLGETMSAHDIAEGRMIVEIGMAVVRPAEFIVFKFSHSLQSSLKGKRRLPNQINIENPMDNNTVISELIKKVGANVKVITTKRKWEDLVLPKRITKQLKDIANSISSNAGPNRGKGIDKALPPAYRAFFHGPAGTGKTFSVSLLGKLTKRKVLKIDARKLLSEYIGETEENLAKLFDAAEQKYRILFFDEADALFGKRTQIPTKDKRYANQEVSYLLQRIETFNGIVILASTLKTNINDAFIRRCQSIIAFPMPKPKERLSIWKGAFSGKAKLADDIDLLAIAKKYKIAGSSIMNAARYSSLKTTRAKQTSVQLSSVEQGIKRELAKEKRRG